MSIRCPSCRHAIAVKQAKAGRYLPKCPNCKKAFSLIVTDGDESSWSVAALPDPAEPLESTRIDPDARHPDPLPVPDASGRTDVGSRRTIAEAGDHGTVGSNLAVDDDVEQSRGGQLGDDEFKLPPRLGGYEIVRELGRGGMGAVYLARQVSLDRPVALKVMSMRWASDPVFLARFTREAYAAAQLVHHNVVQIYDIGEERGINYFSMEYVEGRSLGEIVRKEGRFDPESAVGFTVQAARGLKFAHDRGMIHRDVKPDNLLLNGQGIVKVADLGLVKTPAMTPEDDAPSKEIRALDPKESGRFSRTGLGSLPTGMTHARTAMGSPAYMSPEQCRDAAAVDHRADIYSLGCSLHVLLTGRAPFQGNTALEVMTKHATEAPVPPHQVVPAVPKEVSAIVVKMLAKDPQRRYQDMGALIHDLETWLGASEGGRFRPKEEHLRALEKSVDRFNGSATATMRDWLVKGFVAVTLVGALAFLFVRATFAVGLLALLMHAALAYFIATGLSGRTFLFRKTREVFLGSRVSDFLLWGFGMALFALVLNLVGLLWVWLGFGVLGVIVALGMHFLIDRQVEAQRRPAVADAEAMFKRLRLHGLDEEALRLFVAKNSGRHWEEFFEALFGFEAKLAARAALSEDGVPRIRHAAWRESIVRWLDRIEAARKAARERRLLQKIEAKKLEAEGMNRQEAQEQAEAAAAEMVEQAAEIKAAEESRIKVEGETVAPAAPVNINEAMEKAQKRPKKRARPPAQPLKQLVEFAFGWKLRFVAAALLITGSILWIRQNVAHDAAVQESISSAAGVRDVAQAQEEAGKIADIVKAIVNSDKTWDPLKLSFLPAAIGSFFDHINPFAAGLILLVSIFHVNTVRILLFLLAAAVTCAGHQLGLPEVGSLKPYQVSLAAGGGLALLALIWRERRN